MKFKDLCDDCSFFNRSRAVLRCDCGKTKKMPFLFNLSELLTVQTKDQNLALREMNSNVTSFTESCNRRVGLDGFMYTAYCYSPVNETTGPKGEEFDASIDFGKGLNTFFTVWLGYTNFIFILTGEMLQVYMDDYNRAYVVRNYLYPLPTPSS